MMPHTALSTELTFDYLGVAAEDRAGCLALLEGDTSPEAGVVLDFLDSQLGAPVPAGEPSGGLPTAEGPWLEAMLRFVPALQHWHAERDIPDAVTRDTLADFGRNLAINRRVHGGFGMDTYKWLTHHFAGRIFQLGRLQFLLHQPAAGIPGVSSGEWVAGIHIPENGGLGVQAVAGSLAAAGPFLATHFPDRPVAVANCESWLLDPYLAAHLAPESNIARFAGLFTPYGTPRDEPTDAVYFTFRTRSMENLMALPRTTALQQVVLDRIDAGGTWQLGFGYMPLPH